MRTPDNERETDECVHIGRVLSRVSDKWTLLVVRVLGHGPRRFNALRRDVGKISQKVLASTLRQLEADGFVSRTVMPSTPPQVEYALTDLGREFAVPVQALTGWIVANMDRMDAARVSFDERQAPMSAALSDVGDVRSALPAAPSGSAIRTRRDEGDRK